MLTLKHLSIPELIGAAGGDPWKINDTIQVGSPGEISELATSFRAAGLCITETDEEFLQAKKRFDEAWDRDDPAHPINDAEEVRRATQWLKLSKQQMAAVAADLQSIAATLAEAQRSGHTSIGLLEGQLQRIDDVIEAELQVAIAAGEQLDWSELKRAAVDATKQSLAEMTAVRDAYGTRLDEAELEMAADGYDTDATEGAEPVVVDLERAGVDEVADHLRGVDAVVFAAGAGPGSGAARKETVDRDAAILLADAAEAAGVRRYLMISAMAADPQATADEPVFQAYLRAKGAADEAIRARTALSATIVRPGLLTNDPGTGRVTIAESTGRGSIPREDVAAVLVAALDEPHTGGKTFELISGETPIEEAVAALVR